jgi:hypothetical protein
MDRFLGFACALLLSSPCFAQAPLGTTTTTTTTTTAPSTTIRASQILGSTVHLQGTNNYGKVEDIVLSDDGSATYLVVSSGGRLVMMPFNAATFDQAQRVVTYEVSQQAVRPLQFEQAAYPNVSDQQFTTRVNQVFPSAAGNQKVKFKVKPNGVIKEKIKDR